MESNGVIKKVKSSSCAAPIVVVKKKNTNELRICGDFSVTYNTCTDLVSYPIPRIEDLHAALRGCSVFSVLDMKSAYHQVPVSENSQKYLTINTLQGLYAFSRLPFGFILLLVIPVDNGHYSLRHSARDLLSGRYFSGWGR